MPIGEYTNEQGKELIGLARKSIESYFSKEKIELPSNKEYRQLRGVFVTLNKKGRLRGCVGFPNPVYSIAEAVVRAAIAAAFEDARFPRIKEEELKEIHIELSVLTPPQPVKDLKDIIVGKDGLICSYLGYQGLLLPQVAVEHKMNRIEFLEAVCEKAGIPGDSWQKPRTRFQKFQAQIFREESIS